MLKHVPFLLVGVDAATLNLRGAGSAIAFDSGSNEATLSATCDGKAGAWLYPQPQRFDFGDGNTPNTPPNITILLTDVAPSCALIPRGSPA